MEPVVAVVPPDAKPAEATDAEVVTTVAEDGPPEKNALTLPLLGDQIGMSQTKIEKVCIHNWLGFELFTKLVTQNYLAVLLVLRQMKPDPARVPLQESTLLVFDDTPFVVGNPGIGIKIDEMLNRLDFRTTKQHFSHSGQHVTFGKKLDFLVRPITSSKREFQFIGLSNIEHQFVTHCRLLLFSNWRVLANNASGVFTTKIYITFLRNVKRCNGLVPYCAIAPR